MNNNQANAETRENYAGIKRRDLLLSGGSLLASSALWGLFGVGGDRRAGPTSREET